MWRASNTRRRRQLGGAARASGERDTGVWRASNTRRRRQLGGAARASGERDTSVWRASNSRRRRQLGGAARGTLPTSGLMSRCTTPRLWQWSIASTERRTIWRSSSSSAANPKPDVGCESMKSYKSVPPLERMRKTVVSEWKVANKRHTFSWSNKRIASISVLIRRIERKRFLMSDVL